jgi:hypothetical protein
MFTVFGELSTYGIKNDATGQDLNIQTEERDKTMVLTTKKARLNFIILTTGK